MSLNKSCIKKGPNAKPKKVQFATRVINYEELDDAMKERMEHNLRYNDDTIFDNISIFKDVEKPGHIPKKLK